MRLTSAIIFCGAWFLPWVSATTCTTACHADNCLRAVRATAFPTRKGTADCSSFLLTTVSGTKTVVPTAIPTYASACKGQAGYTSACSCIGVKPSTTTVHGGGSCGHPTSSPSSSPPSSSTPSGAPSSSPPSSSTPSGTPSSGYVIVSPTSCPPALKPAGTPIAQSDQAWSDAHNGLSYQQYPNSQYILTNSSTSNSNGTNSNMTVTTFYADLFSPDRLILSDPDGNMLIFFANGTWVAYAGLCELEIHGTWDSSAAPLPATNLTRRAGKPNTIHNHPLSPILLPRQSSSPLCNDIQFFCSDPAGVAAVGFAAAFACASISQQLGAYIGGGIGFLGNALGPEVGIPTTLAGVVLGRTLGAFLARRFGQALCGAAASYLLYELCQACPPVSDCGPGTVRCGGEGSECQDSFRDPNNCGGCGVVCQSGVCLNGQCSDSVCDGSVCNSLNDCGSGCFCFMAAGAKGFCGPNVPCSPLADCATNADCAQGLVCATGTCCGRNVCLQSCLASQRRRRDLGSGWESFMLEGRNVSSLEEEVWTGGKPPSLVLH